MDKYKIPLLILLWLIALFVFTIGYLKADTLEFEWDYDNTTDGFSIYQGVPNESWEIVYDPTPFISNIPPEARYTSKEVEGIPNTVQKYCYRIRAYRGSEESPDSNEVCIKIDNTKPQSPTNLTSSYDSETKMVTLQWDQSADTDRIKYWTVYFRADDGTEFSELARIENNGQESMSITESIETGNGELFFVVVAFKSAKVFSDDSTTTSIVINYDEPLPPPQLRLKVQIPVEEK